MHEIDGGVGLQQIAPGPLAGMGSPETSSTRSRSRTPSIVTTARLLSWVSSFGERRRLDLDDVGAAVPTVIGSSIGWPTGTSRLHDVAVPTARSTGAVPPRAGSSTR